MRCGLGGCVAIIPARGGSKRIPGKNIRPFLGVPLLARTVAILRASQVFDRIVVSTYDDDIAAVAEQAGAEVPFRRPAELADDHTGTAAVVRQSIRQLEEFSGGRLSQVCCVYPAAVLVTPDDLRDGLGLLDEHPTDRIMTGVSFPHPILRAYRVDATTGLASMIWPEHRMSRSQDLEEAYHDAGQFYWAHRDVWLDEDAAKRRTRILTLPRWQVQDIDTLEDWQRAELAYEVLQRRAGQGKNGDRAAPSL